MSNYIKKNFNPDSQHNLIAEEFFAAKRRRPVKTLAGIEVNILARTYELAGDTVIVGDIPDDVLLVVRNGNLHVAGYVFGHVISSGNIDVTENVHGGWVISSKGNISVRRILSKAKVVAQIGDIFCKGAESPEVIFAARQLSVDGDVSAGRLVGKTVCINGVVRSAEIHAAGPAVARSFEAHFSRHTIICLRSWLSSEDYGCAVSDSARTIRRTMTKHRFNISVMAGMIRYSRVDVINSFRSMFFYLVRGVDSRVLICKLRGAQSKAIYLEQIIEAGSALTKYLNNAKRSSAEIEAQEVAAVADECLRSLVTIEKGIDYIPAEFGTSCKETSLMTLKQLRNAAKKIKVASRTNIKISKFLEALDHYITGWQNLLNEATDEIRQSLHEFGIEPYIPKQIETNPENIEAMLKQKLNEANANPGSEIYERANSIFMRLMLRTVDRHSRYIDKWRQELQVVKDEIKIQRKRLAEDPTIILGIQKKNMIFAKSSHFESGIILTSESDLLRYSTSLDPQIRQRNIELLAQAKETNDAPTIQVRRSIDKDITFFLNGTKISTEPGGRDEKV